MDRSLLIISTLCFFLAMVRTALEIKARNYRAGGFNFAAIALGFVFQTAFLSVRGHALGRCPLTNLFEVFIFIAWSVSLIYLLIGPAYRLSLMGAFTAPLVFLLQTFALLAPIDRPHTVRIAPSPWMEMHASVSLIAYGAFALACVAGLMYLAAGASTQDPGAQFDVLSFPAADGSFRGHHPAPLARLCAPHAGNCGRVSHRPAAALRQDRMVVRRLDLSTPRSCSRAISGGPLRAGSPRFASLPSARP